MIKLCVEGSDCSFATVGEAKALDYSSIASLSAVKAEPSPLSKALTPSMATMSESIRSLQAQKLVSMASLSITGNQQVNDTNMVCYKIYKNIRLVRYFEHNIFMTLFLIS